MSVRELVLTLYISNTATTAPKAVWRGGSAPDASLAMVSRLDKPPNTIFFVFEAGGGDEVRAAGLSGALAGVFVFAGSGGCSTAGGLSGGPGSEVHP